MLLRKKNLTYNCSIKGSYAWKKYLFLKTAALLKASKKSDSYLPKIFPVERFCFSNIETPAFWLYFLCSKGGSLSFVTAIFFAFSESGWHLVNRVLSTKCVCHPAEKFV
jgi:hypothetical protein